MEEDITICRVCGTKLKKDGLCDNCGWIRIVMPKSAPKNLLDLRSRSIEIMKEKLQQINDAQETEVLKGQIETLTKQAAELAQANDVLKSKAGQLEDANNSLKANTQQLTDDNASLNDKIRALTEANERLSNACEEKDKTIQSQKDANENLSKACEEKDSTIQNQKEALKPAITKIKELTTALEEAEARNKEMSSAPLDGQPKLVGMVRIIDSDGQELWMTVFQGKNVYGTEPSESAYPNHHRHTIYNIISNAEAAFMPEHFVIEADYDTFYITDLSGTMRINDAEIQPNTKYNDMYQGITMDSDGERYNVIVKLV